MRTAEEHGCTPMFAACICGHLKVAQWLFGAGAAEDARTANMYEWTPMCIACQKGNLKVALWLIYNGAVSSDPTGHVSASIMITSEASTVPDLRSVINTSITDNSNFSALILPSICDLHRGPDRRSENKRAAPCTRSRKRIMHTIPGPCQLPKFRGLESSVVALIADFAGVVRGRQLRNLREAALCL